MNKAFKFRLYPTKEQQQVLAQQFGSIRFVYNNTLAYKKELYNAEKKHISKHDLIKRLVSLKKEFVWLKEADSQALQQSVMHVDKAFKNFFSKRAQFPRFKKKDSSQSIHYPQRVKVDEQNKKAYLPKVGWVKIKIHRPLEGKIKTVSISRAPSGKYHASILCEIDRTEPILLQHMAEDKVIGIDMGLHDICVSSDGMLTSNPKFIERASKNLRRKQKKLSRKKVGSIRRNKARITVARAHEKITNARAYFQHTLTKKLADENQAVILEDLNIKGMIKNRKLSKAIADASWYAIAKKLEYKLAWQGKHLVKIDRFYASTKRCNSCGEKQVMPLNKRIYSCSCSWKTTRDINAALNIKKQGIKKLKAAGYTVSARGGLRKTDLSAVACEPRSLFL